MQSTIIKSVMMVLVALFSLNAYTIVKYDVEDDLFYYKLDDSKKVATVYGKGNLFYGDRVHLAIPSSITTGGTTYSVTSIGKEAFQGCSGFTSVTIPNSITSIGADAFYACYDLKNVYIKDIASWCGISFGNEYSTPFSYAHHLYLNGAAVKNLTIPNSVTSIGSYAFYGCSGLTSLTIPNSVTFIGTYAFYGCSGLTSLTIPNSVTSIGWSAFEGCSGLTSVTIPNSVTSIGWYAFSGCSGLTSVTIPNSVTSINDCTFYGCSGLTSVTIPNSVTSIDEEVFKGCSGLKSVTIPNSVTSIGKEAFSGCSGLTSVTIPNSVTSIGNYAFNGCSGLKSVHITDIASWCGISFVDSYSNPLSFAHHLYLNGAEVKDLTIPNSIISLGDFVFGGCSGLTSVTIPNSVTSINDCTFHGCSGLTSVTIPNSVTSIGKEAFKGCSGLTSVTIGNSVTSIGRWAFQDCSGLTSVTIGNSVTSIGNRAFNGCSGLKSITIPNSVTSLGDYVFDGCSGLTSVTIGNSVTSIGGCAFYGCSGLTSVTLDNNWIVSKYHSDTHSIANFFGSHVKEYIIGNNVTSIGQSAFLDCSGLTSVTIGNSVTSIGKEAFKGCSRLTSVTIPNSVTSIGNDAFLDCSGLKSVTIPGSVKSIGGYAFGHCSGLKSVTIPYGVKSIGENAFWCCSGLTSVTIPNSVTSIGSSAFTNCSGLTSVTIPISVRSIGDYAFSCCSELTSVVSESENPFALGTLAFANISELCRLTVPYGTKDAYIEKGWTTKVFKRGIVEAFAPKTLATSISLDQASVTLDDNNRTVKLTATILPDNVTIKEAIWTSSNESVAMVNDEGVVTAMGNGTATITAETTDGSNLSATCDVVVNLTKFQVAIPHNGGTVDMTFLLNQNGSVSVGPKSNASSFESIEPCIAKETQGALVIPAAITFGTQTYPVKRIEDVAFYGCNNLTSISIPNSVTHVSFPAFWNCTLTSLFIPSSVSKFPLEGVYWSDEANVPHGLIATNIVVDGNNAKYDSRDNCNAIIQTATNKLVMGCDGTVIPDGITSIGTSAFIGCTLSSITIPSSVTSIQGHAFAYCSNLTSVVSEIEEPFAFGSDAFSDIASICTLTVPAGTRDAYIAAGWTEEVFKGGIVEAEPEPYKVGDDITSLAAAEWEGKTGDYGGLANPAVERYTHGAPADVDDILTQTVSGLRNGTYRVQLEVAASFTPERGFDCPTGDGLSVAFANSTQRNLPVMERTWVSEGEQKLLTLTATVTDGTLKYGIKNLNLSGNWFVARLKSIVYASTDAQSPQTYAISIAPEGNGTTTTDVAADEEGSRVFITTTPDEDCTLESLKVTTTGGQEVEVTNNNSFIMPASAVTVTATYILRQPIAINIVESEVGTEFSIDEDRVYETINYTRTFKNTGWQALYVPFSMTLDDWEDNFEVARISTIFLEDLNGNGVIEPANSVQPEQKMLIVKIGDAQRGMRLRPNYPYLIKAKRASNTPQTITVHNATLYATAENSYDCSTLENTFTFTGIYHQKKNLDNPRVYYMGGGKVAYTTSSTTALNPFRWYMQMTERDGSLLPAEALPNEIKLVVMDEDGEITSIEGLDGTNIMAQPARKGWWTLSGVQLPSKPTRKGIYIHDGKKVSIQ